MIHPMYPDDPEQDPMSLWKAWIEKHDEEEP